MWRLRSFKFISYGEVTVEQVNLKTFFEELEVKGLVRGIVIEVPTLGLPTQTPCSHDAWSAWNLGDNRPLFK